VCSSDLQALLEGLLLFVILRLATHRQLWLQRRGVVAGLFLAGYGAFRLSMEWLREPDAQMLPFLRDYRFNETEGTLQVRSDRRDHRPFGLYGGSPGAPSANWLNPDGENRALPGKFTMTVRRGDVLRHVLAGAGGWGDPLERDPTAVLKDVRNELLSPAKARADYGVVVDTVAWTVDTAATAAARAALRERRGWRETPVVQWHDPVIAARAAE
jgi:N-methylhydantoinase B